MDILLKRRKLLKSKVTRMCKLLDKILASENNINVHEVNLYSDQISVLWNDANSMLEEFVLVCESDDTEQYEADLYQCMDRLDAMKIAVKTVSSKCQNNSVSTSENQNISSSEQRERDVNVNLPRIELPSFAGDFHQWLSFRDLFVASIHSNEKLNAVQKLQYLKLCLKGEAASLLYAIQVTEDNYERAWQMLNKRYHNVSEIVYAQLDRLFNQATLNQESAAGLRKLIDTTSECMDSLEILKQPVKEWGCILVYLIRKKLDPETLRQWEMSKVGDTLRGFEEFLEFLDVRAKALATLGINKPKQTVSSNECRKVYKSYPAAHHIASPRCSVCEDIHSIYKCSKFLGMTVDKRLEVVKNHNLCFNCLRSGHGKDQCHSTPCKKCDKWHNTLLHYPRAKALPSPDSDQSSYKESNEIKSSSTLNHCSEHTSGVSQILLPTAVILIRDSRGYSQPCRALLDSGSQSNLIREDCVQRLGLHRHRANVTVSGLSSTRVGHSNGIVKLEISSSCSDFFMETEAIILRKITCDLPQYTVSVESLNCFTHLKLADPWFFKPGSIDLLLSAEVFAKVILAGKCESSSHSAIALESVFGWVISGKFQNADPSHQSVTVHHVSCDVDTTLQKFWEIEDLPQSKTDLSLQEKKCEAHFASTHSRDETGWFVVRLPFCDQEQPLGASKPNAVQRLKQIERKLNRNPVESELYRSFMKQYLELNHMEKVLESKAETNNAVYYIPHHCVGKEANSPTKFRVVFDASAKTASGVSLNDQLLVGPTIQDSLITHLIRFRTFKIAVKADITKMYRQIRIHEEDTDYQRIVWRSSPDEPMQEYRLLTVTYGTASAPYMATRCLKQLAEDESERFPLAAHALKTHFYMDDLMSGADTIKEALQLQMEVIKILKAGGFELRKFSSNENRVLQNIEPEMRDINVPLRIDSDDSIKTLGLNWHPASDTFSFKVNIQDANVTVTKRSILSNVARIFDPLGWLAPVVIKGKIILQKLWKLKLDWDDCVPSPILEEWQTLCKELPNMETIKIPRCIVSKEAQYELHGFCDASESAYSAVVYLKNTYVDGGYKIELLMARTKVAPIKTVSIPRLELCGALLLANLMKVLHTDLKLEVSEIHAWTDSTIVLAWLKSEPSHWKTFVANRVSKIQNLVPTVQWHHVPGEINPADCASRGVYPSQLQTDSLWWNGPDLLRSSRILSSDLKTEDHEEIQMEERSKGNVYHVNTNDGFDLLKRFSSLTKLKRVTAYCLRFSFNARSDANIRRYGPLSTKELSEAFVLLVKIVQDCAIPFEIQALKANKPLSCKSNIAPLNPFLDGDGLLRVGGRLRKSNLAVDQKHPMLLPKSHEFTRRVILHYHLVNLHAGNQLLQATIQQQFWIVSVRDEIRQFLRKCMICMRHKAAVMNQMMGDLPSSRITPAHAFLRSGVDYTGPFTLQITKGRGRKQVKCYVALFVCFVTRAIHIELVSDMSTDAFLAALKRFISRRGKPSDMYSDCGTNFMGAKRKLSEFEKIVQSKTYNESISSFLTTEGVMWHFNPPASPHMGGLWEAGIKSLKFHLKRVVGKTVFTIEEFSTILTQIEACLNSRPITPMSSDPNDYTALTPGHFLIGRPLTSLPEPSYEDITSNRLNKWQLSQRAFQHFWKRWCREYLSRLQQRPKWLKKSRNLEVGDLVLLKEDDLPPLQWNLARVVSTHPGNDGCVRVVTVKTGEGKLLKRSIPKLCQLPLDCC